MPGEQMFDPSRVAENKRSFAAMNEKLAANEREAKIQAIEKAQDEFYGPESDEKSMAAAEASAAKQRERENKAASLKAALKRQYSAVVNEKPADLNAATEAAALVRETSGPVDEEELAAVNNANAEEAAEEAAAVVPVEVKSPELPIAELAAPDEQPAAVEARPVKDYGDGTEDEGGEEHEATLADFESTKERIENLTQDLVEGGAVSKEGELLMDAETLVKEMGLTIADIHLVQERAPAKYGVKGKGRGNPNTWKRLAAR